MGEFGRDHPEPGKTSSLIYIIDFSCDTFWCRSRSAIFAFSVSLLAGFHDTKNIALFSVIALFRRLRRRSLVGRNFFFPFFSLRSFAILCVAKRAKVSRPALLIASSHLILN